jgi:hypothetical protein
VTLELPTWKESMRPALSWSDGFLYVDMPGLPGSPLHVHYLEAYCRAGAHDRAWDETVIPHTTRVTRSLRDGSALWLCDTLADGVIARHAVRAVEGGVIFGVTAHNPTRRSSELHWAQPCLRLGEFAGCAGDSDPDAILPRVFIFLDDHPTFLPTQPWATEARYTPGQVWRASDVQPEDVNPRPLSPLVPSRGIIGCLSVDGEWVAVTAWQPLHELFLGIYHCIHADFHIGGLAPGETKRATGRLGLFHHRETGARAGQIEVSVLHSLVSSW